MSQITGLFYALRLWRSDADGEIRRIPNGSPEYEAELARAKDEAARAPT